MKSDTPQKRLYNKSLKANMLTIVIICLFALIISGVLSIVAIFQVNSINKSLTENLIPALVTAEEINTLTSDFRLKEFSHVTAEDPDEMNLTSVQIEELNTSIYTNMEEYYKTALGDDSKKLMDKARFSWNQYLSYHNQIISLSQENKLDTARVVLMGDAKTCFDRASEEFLNTVDHNKEKASLAQKRSKELSDKLLVFLLVVFITCITLVSTFTFQLLSAFNKSLNKINDIVAQVTKGNFRHSISYSGYHEVNILSNAINTLVHHLNNIIGDEVNYLHCLGQENFEVESTAPGSYVGDLKPIYSSLEQLKGRLKEAKETEYKVTLFEVLAERIDNVFIIYDRINNHCEYVFSNIWRVLGISAEQAYENPLCFLDYCNDNDFSKAIEESFKEEFIHVFIQQELEFTHPQTKEKRWLKFTISPVESNGMVSRYILGFEDLTTMQRAQNTLRDALLNAQNSSKVKNVFFSNMSHEIRTPLNAIIGMTTIATSAIDNPAKLEDCLTKIMFSSKHLLSLINDILDISKIENGKLSIENEPFRLEALVNEINDIIYLQAELNQQEFNVILSPDIPYNLIGDKMRLKQILLNLLANSLKFTQSGGHISLEMKDTAKRFHNTNYIQFIVSDDGCGMAEEFLERIFLPFEQENSKINAPTTGTGLGLAIVKNLVDLMNGTIGVNSTLGQGTEFVVEIPFLSNQNDLTVYKDKSLDKIRTLIVDDSKDTCEYVAVLLNQMDVYADWVLSGQEALERIQNTRYTKDNYDVAIIDWKMPDMDGIETTKQIRKLTGPDAIIIIISAYDWKAIEFQAREAGANAFISKPMFQSSLFNTLVSVVKGYEEKKIEDTTITYDFTGKRIMLVEDNELNREIAIELLKKTNVTIEVAIDGQIAIDQYISKPFGYYDAILMDVQMPRKNGYEATREIRKSGKEDATKIPIIAMTANAFAEDAFAAMNAGMNAHISKPIDTQILFQTLDEKME